MKTLFFDVETAPMKSYHFGRRDQYITQDMVIQEGFLLSFAYKWAGDKKVTCHKAIDFMPPEEVKNGNDLALTTLLWEVLDEADLVVGHYSKKFDVVVSNTRFLHHGLPPPSPFRQVDTKEAASRFFKFSSNKLGDVATMLGVGSKLPNEGFLLWRKCLEGDDPASIIKAMNKMGRYNKQDVVILERVYEKMLPFISNHPSVSVYSGGAGGGDEMCPRCGGGNLVKEGFKYTNLSKFQQYRCKDCGSWSRGRTNLLEKEKRMNLLTN